MEDHVDPRTRSKVTLSTSSVLNSPISTGFLTRLILSNLLLVFALIAGKEWILDEHASPLWLTVRVLGCGAMGALVWIAAGRPWSTRDLEWSTLWAASALTLAQQVALYTALQRLSAVRTLILMQSSTFIVQCLSSLSLTRGSFASAVALILTILSSARFSLRDLFRVFPAYIALLIYTLSTHALESPKRQIELSHGKGTAYCLITGVAFLLSVLFYGLGISSTLMPEPPIIPLTSFIPVPLIALSLLYALPRTTRTVHSLASRSGYFFISLSSTTVFGMVLGYLAFHQEFSIVDVIVVGLLIYGMSAPQPGGVAATSSAARIARAYLKTILSNPESRRIFYFLMLNLAYMVVQVVYGVITNSLGLISDAIHMAFDCMAIAMGLFASVAATWMPNEQFTYGYGRIETLSGFANGIFLLLISLFIVFEAVQRLLDPPEMNTSQLLLVSVMGLAVNIFGMFAMGGHHHHGGHSHSHEGHSHGDSSLKATQLQTHSHSTTPHPHSEHAHFRSKSHASPLAASSIHPPHASASGDALQRVQRQTHRRISSLAADSGGQLPPTPLTPNYRFGEDDHFAEHHHSHHVPNSHDHAHHQSTHEGHSHNMRGVFLHVMADTLGSVGVIISTLLIQFYGWTGFDPIASLFIAVLIAASVVPLVIDSGRVLALDVGDKDDSIRKILSELVHIEGVASYSQPRFWPKDATHVVGSIHIQLKASAASVDPAGPHASRVSTYANVGHVLDRVDALLRSGIQGLTQLTIQVDGRKVGSP